MPPVASKTSSKPILWHRDEDFKAGTVNGIHPPTYGATLGGIRGPITTSGFHHIALVCKNMKEQIKFYECAMGMKLRAIYPMHGIKGARHCFLEGGIGNEISFVEFQEPMPSINPPSFFQVWNQGMLHHMAYKCDSLEQLHKLRQQIKDYGVPVSKIVNHGFCHSCYFTDPSGYNLELACTVRGYTDDEYDITILDRKLRDDENVHEESDTHGKNVIKPKL